MLQDIVFADKSDLSSALFADERKQELDTKTDKKIFDLMKNISSIALKITDTDVEFFPLIVMNGKRSFSVEDLEENDYILLYSLNLDYVPLKLKVRISDILWTQKKDYEYAQIAAEAYFDLFNLMFSDDDWVKALDMIKRAICIAAQINQKDLYNSCCKTLYDIIIKIDGKDKKFLSISFIETILAQSYSNIKTIIDISKIIDILDKIILCNKNNPYKIEQAYLLKSRCFNKQKNTVSAAQANIDMAEYFVNFAESLLKDGKQEVLRAEMFFQKAVILYRNNGESSKAEKTHLRLVEIQRDKLKLMHTHTSSFDVSKIIKNIDQNMEGLSFEECIIRLTQMVFFYKKYDIKQQVLKDLKSFPLINILPKHLINSSGQTIFKLPPLNISNPEEDESILELHIHNKMFEYQNISGNIYLYFSLLYIKENFDIDSQNLEFLVSDNFIIPEGRENIFLSAIRMALKGDCYESLHILAPQTENIFRNIAKEVGGLTVTLETDGTSKEKVLSSIFDLPELVDCYDNDILFLFKGLLNEQAGANIRNNIAHGIITPEAANSGASLYFICAVIKLLVFSSRRCSEIFSNNHRLQKFINPESDIVEPNDE